MSHTTLLQKLKTGELYFSDVIEYIEQRYIHTPTAFWNGEIHNEATQNQGSAKVFQFASLAGLNEEDTLLLFAEHYRAVTENPNGDDHQNIRAFMLHGWEGIRFEGAALSAK